MATNGGFKQFTRPALSQGGCVTPNWVADPMIYTSPEAAQAYLDRLDQRRAFDDLRDFEEELDRLPKQGEPGEQLLLIDIPIQRYAKCFV